MTDKKISELSAITPAAGDLIPVVDISEADIALKNKYITPSQLAFSGGWTPAAGTWVFSDAGQAAAGLLTVGDNANFAIGTKLKFTQDGTVHYASVTSLFIGTAVYITGGSDYTFSVNAITTPYFSNQESPAGFPDVFNTATITVNVATFDNGSGGQPATVFSRFSIVGRKVSHLFQVTGIKAATGPSIAFTRPATMPIPSTVAPNYLCYGSCWGADYVSFGIITSGNGATFTMYFTANIADNTALPNGVSGMYSYFI